jgi:hypothetical protein
VRYLPERLLICPTVQLFSTSIPVSDHVIHVAHKNRVVCEVEKAGALPQNFFASHALGYFLLQLFVSLSEFRRPPGDFDLQFVARLPNMCLGPSPHNAEPNQ